MTKNPRAIDLEVMANELREPTEQAEDEENKGDGGRALLMHEKGDMSYLNEPFGQVVISTDFARRIIEALEHEARKYD